MPAEKQGITLHQLLTHTAGLKANYKGDYTPATRQQLEQHALNSRLRSRPGETFNYSNIGYSLLALVIFGISDRWGTPVEQSWAKDGPWWSLHGNGGANDFFDMDIYNYIDDGVVLMYVTNTPLQQSLMPKLSNVVRKEYIQ